MFTHSNDSFMEKWELKQSKYVGTGTILHKYGDIDILPCTYLNGMRAFREFSLKKNSSKLEENGDSMCLCYVLCQDVEKSPY